MTMQERGKLKIFMGYAAGVGKTYKMLEEAHVLKSQGIDIVVGYFEPHGRQDTITRAQGLEMIQRKKIEYRGAIFEEMDTDCILARRPQVCLVDEFPHSNVPGSSREKRWEDVTAVLDARIDVLTTMNIQHLESLNDQIRQITGVTVRETIPDWIVQEAAEVVMVDLSPRALLHRLERGAVYRPEQAQRALQNFFREPALVALRELALREAAHGVGQRITGDNVGVPHDRAQQQLQVRQKILVYLTPDPKTAMVIRRAKRVSDFLGGECLAIAMQETSDLSDLSPPEREALQKHLNFARNLHIETHLLRGDDASTLVNFARENGVAQIFLIRPRGRAWPRLILRDAVQEVIDHAKDMQIVIVSDRDPAS